MRFVYLFVILFTLSACIKDTTNTHEENEPVSAEHSGTENDIASSTEETGSPSPSEYKANNEEKLSEQDIETALELCSSALASYYKAIWNDAEIELDTFIENENLKRYMQTKIEYHSVLYGKSDPVKDIEIGAWEVEYTDDEDGGYFYFDLPVIINKYTGGRGEGIELLVRNDNGRLVIADWYDGGKDSYDFLVRGENSTIDNPTIWNDREWVEQLTRKQSDFSGSVR